VVDGHSIGGIVNGVVMILMLQPDVKVIRVSFTNPGLISGLTILSQLFTGKINNGSPKIRIDHDPRADSHIITVLSKGIIRPSDFQTTAGARRVYCFDNSLSGFSITVPKGWFGTNRRGGEIVSLVVKHYVVCQGCSVVTRPKVNVSAVMPRFYD